MAVLGSCTFQVPVQPLCEGAFCPQDLSGPPPVGSPADLGAPDLSAPDLVPPLDPGRDGPLPVGMLEVRVPIPGPFNDTDVTILAPGRAQELDAGPFPLVLISPAMWVPRDQYLGYARRLASHGLMAAAQSPRNELDVTAYRNHTRSVLDWLLAPSGQGADRVRGRADPSRVGLLGHGRGAKISFLVAAIDSRIRALLAIDPVDSSEALTARMVVPGLNLGGAALVLLGETVSRGGGAACPQPDEDFEALYMLARGPAVRITFSDAGHHDFVADRARCGWVCAVCPSGSSPPERTHALAVKYAAAYFLHALAGRAEALSFLTGAGFLQDAQSGAVTQVSK